MTAFLERLKAQSPGVVGTWIKLSTLETMEMLGHAGFQAVVIDTEHGPHSHETTYKLTFAAQAMGMGALVRLPDLSAHDAQRVLDAGADGVLLPRVRTPEIAANVVRSLIFSPEGDRGLGSTSRAGRWGMRPMGDYLEKGRMQTLRMIQLEDMDAIENVEQFCKVDGVNGIFLGLGDLMLSSGLPPSDPKVVALVENARAVTRAYDITCGIAAGTAEAGASYRDMGFDLVMVSNDCTLFGRAAQAIIDEYHGGGGA